MYRNEYLERFVDGVEQCLGCHQSAITGDTDKMPAWKCTVDLAKKYDVKAHDLYDAVCRGKFTYWESEEFTGGPARFFLREADVARIYALRPIRVPLNDQPLAFVQVA